MIKSEEIKENIIVKEKIEDFSMSFVYTSNTLVPKLQDDNSIIFFDKDKMIKDKNDLWLFAGMVIIAANAGGAWSPIGDVTTIMLWIGGQITATNIILQILVPSLVCLTVPLLVLSFSLKGNIATTSDALTSNTEEKHIVSNFEKTLIQHLELKNS